MTAPAGDALVILDGVTVRRRGRAVLDGSTFTVAGGSSLAVGGDNGSGKTTLLRLLANLYRPDEGRRRGPDRAAFVPAAMNPPAVSVERWLRSVPRPGRRAPDAALAEAAELGFDATSATPCRALSFGNLRKLLLAEALTSGEPLIVIDEATGGLDDQGLAALSDRIAACCTEGATVVTADQGAEPVLPLDRFVIVEEGRLTDRPVTMISSAPARSVLSLTGPVARRAALLRVAAELGWVPVDQGEPVAPSDQQPEEAR